MLSIAENLQRTPEPPIDPMKAPYEFGELNDSGILLLAEQTMRYACVDWLRAVRALKRHPDNGSAFKIKRECETFFNHSFAAQLVSPDSVMAELRKLARADKVKVFGMHTGKNNNSKNESEDELE